MDYYNGPDPRYVQYTKGFTTAASHQIERGTVEYTRFGSEYFSGANVGVYFGDVLVDQILQLEFNLQEQIIPVYGYGSYTYDAVAKGQRIVNGRFSIYFKEAGYLRLLINQLEYELKGAAKTNPFKYDTVPEEVTIENILGRLKSLSASEFDRLSTAYEEAIWGTKSNQYSQLLEDRLSQPYFTPFKDVNLNSRGFDILISYGPEARRQKRNLGELSAKTTVQSINGVHLTGVRAGIDPSGQPLFEEYTFIAKDINNNVHSDLISNT